jgi:hypothetical protein
MGIFGPSKGERLNAQYVLIKENEIALSEGNEFLAKKDQLNAIIDPGFDSDDLGQILNSYRQAYSLTMMYRYILHTTKTFNQLMCTLYANSLSKEQQAFTEFLEEIEGKMIKLRARAHSQMEISEIRDLEERLNNSYGEGRYGNTCR